jgi:hypothetical protein
MMHESGSKRRDESRRGKPNACATVRGAASLGCRLGIRAEIFGADNQKKPVLERHWAIRLSSSLEFTGPYKLMPRLTPLPGD